MTMTQALFLVLAFLVVVVFFAYAVRGTHHSVREQVAR
jgi:hypothetical protein